MVATLAKDDFKLPPASSKLKADAFAAGIRLGVPMFDVAGSAKSVAATLRTMLTMKGRKQ